MLRGVFDFVDDPRINAYRDMSYEAWVRRQSNAPYGIPRFPTRDAALAANATLPLTPHACVVDNYDFLMNTVVPFLRDMSPATFALDLPPTNASDAWFPDGESDDTRFVDPVSLKLEMLKPQQGPDALERTFRYLYHHMRCGIVVAIHNRAVVCFCPFYNPDFANTWPPGTPSGAEDVVGAKLPVNKWWTNGGILCNEPGPWGTHFNMQLKDMISEAANKYAVDNAVFFLNKRDYPQYKFNADIGRLVEPYGFVYDRDDRDPFQDIGLSTVDGADLSLYPILSFYGTSCTRFLDILIPPTEDWEAAHKYVYLNSMTHVPMLSRASLRELSVPDEPLVPVAQKRPVAFFRGAATGAGTSALTNQRIRLFSTAQALQSPLLDVACVSLNRRLRKHFSEPVGMVPETVDFPVSDMFFVPMAQQLRNKYLIYVEGHCAACRLGMMLASGSVVLKVDSSVPAPDLWYTHLLQDGEHFVSVREDLSNLVEVVEELEADPRRAQRIADAARAFWNEHLSPDGLVRYMGIVCAFVAATQAPE